VWPVPAVRSHRGALFPLAFSMIQPRPGFALLQGPEPCCSLPHVDMWGPGQVESHSSPGKRVTFPLHATGATSQGFPPGHVTQEGGGSLGVSQGAELQVEV
jgi:hypothetical protein